MAAMGLIFSGKFTWRKQQTLTSWKRQFCQKYGDFHFEKHLLSSGNARDIAQSLRIIPFFSEKRLLFIDASSISQSDLDSFAFFLEECQNSSEKNILLMDIGELAPSDWMLSLQIKNFDFDDEKICLESLMKYHPALNYLTAQKLLRYCNYDQNYLWSELEPFTYLSNLPSSAEVYFNSIPPCGEFGLFETIDALFSSNPKPLLTTLEKEGFAAFIPQFLGGIRNGTQIALLSGLGYSDMQIRETLPECKPFLIQKYSKLTGSQKKALIRLYSFIIRFDFFSKNGTLTANEAEQAIISRIIFFSLGNFQSPLQVSDFSFFPHVLRIS